MNEVKNSIQSFQTYIDKAVELTMGYAPKVILALVFLIVGLKVISGLTKFISKALEKRQFDPTLRPFIRDIVSWSLKALLFISVASMVGIQTTSFVALIGAVGLAVGLALQGTLSNFAGGILILLFKPFKVGDLVEAKGHLGTVEEIQVFMTKIQTRQNRVVIIPNGELSNDTVVNWSDKEAIRVDLVVGISYNDDIKLARDTLYQAVSEMEDVLQVPAPVLGVDELGDNSVNLVVRPWCKPENYFKVRYKTLEVCKYALDKVGITIPFPQRDVHLFQHEVDKAEVEA